jgi:hypothetical protein
MYLEAGVGIEPAYTALQASAVLRQINQLRRFHFRQTGTILAEKRFLFKDCGRRGESDLQQSDRHGPTSRGTSDTLQRPTASNQMTQNRRRREPGKMRTYVWTLRQDRITAALRAGAAATHG